MTNLSTLKNGATTSGDYLSIFTTDYNNSPYNVTVVLTATLQGSALMIISKTIYLNAYLARFIVPPHNSFKYFLFQELDLGQNLNLVFRNLKNFC